jgi:branched-chain amino acid transport system permease protein
MLAAGMDATFLAQLLFNGLVIGLLYGLIAVGLALVYGVLRIVNFAHGELIMLGAYAMALVTPVLGLLYLPSVAAAALLAAAIGFVLFELLFARLRETDFERSILVTTGLSIILLHGVQWLFSPSGRMVDTEFGFAGVEIGDIRTTATRLAAGGIAILAFAALWLILMRTQFGRAMRAIAQNRDAALMVGIPPRRVARNALVLAAALCGIAGAALAPVYLVQPIMGQPLLFKAFALVIIGGLGHLQGAAIAAVVLGMIESVVGGFLTIVWQEAVVFVAMIAVLLLRPQGLFAARIRVG